MFCNTTGHPIISRTWFYNGIEVQNRLNYLNYNVNHIKYTFFSWGRFKGTSEKSNFLLVDRFRFKEVYHYLAQSEKKKKEKEKKLKQENLISLPFPI